MPNVRRLIAATFVLALVFSAAVPVMAQEEETTDTTVAGEDGATATTVAEEGAIGGEVAPPAVSMPDAAADEEPLDWTYRFLIPTLLAMAVVVVVVTTIQYFLRVVRNRYKVVE